ncbi:hypothetical protein BX616_003222 [Lobosporangium transversale]|uniref:Protein phosphatase 1 regulatory subunit 21 N-terminal domain-containing protein n=1 Tax=Lobosporangium transversale TaxID=64571 RepID=A0A1Y2GTG2_9FUNG|nr:hypothetical protein BCR41DRAFT_385488 [Lobosporangium transversale]KAF9899147.1 hypothetical protein BX616_003222 [Lobosporangium transversale]ORZ20985.1 hypothetical protein BCR41DRAFT_385488 [Lobosporangium transversale]|eukprot:XP_021882894.1 hypothetical protein BCR41DRAFT_385488 [Lobosporangium transversale]
MNDSEELAEKYRKLHQEFIRIKAQHAVLKKAVLEEQTKNAAIQNSLKEKEQEVRKSLQDLDLLTYHNQRLTRRIESLQSQASAKSGGSWLMGGGNIKKELEKSQVTLEALTIDLEAKIEENEKLHQQLYDINALYPRHVTELKGKIQELEKQNQELQLDVERAGVANEDTINLIRKEKEETEKELGIIRDALAGQLQDEQRANQSLRGNVQRLENEIERLSKVELEYESLKLEHTKLRDELETHKWISSELSQLQESYSNLERDKIQIEKAHAQLSSQYTALKQAEEGLRRALAQEQQNVRSVQEQAQHLKRDLEITRSEAANREKGHVAKIEQLQSELENAYQEQKKIREQYEDLRIAEQSAKEDESRTKASFSADLANLKSSLAGAEARIEELEQLKRTLETELSDTKRALEGTQMVLKNEQGTRSNNTEKPVATVSESDNNMLEKEGKKKKEQEQEAGEESKPKPEHEESHIPEDDAAEKEKPPLSKKAKKKKGKAAAAAAAAAAVAETESKTGSSQIDGKHDESDGQKDKVVQDTKDIEKKDTLKTKAESEEQTHREENQMRKALEDSLRIEIDSLQKQIEQSQQSNVSTQEELNAAKAALESIKDEKISLSSSLEFHVDLAKQLQEEIEDLKSKLSKKQKHHGVNGSTAGREEAHASEDQPQMRVRQQKNILDTKEGGSQTPQRASTPVPTGTAGVDLKKIVVDAKDESTQVEKADALDKAVQSEAIEHVDESTQVDVIQKSSVAVGTEATSVIEEANDTEKTKDSKDSTFTTVKTGKLMDNKSSRNSMIGDEGTATDAVIPSTAAAAANINISQSQMNREYLIKKHYETKIQNIIEQLQLSDGRYVRLHREFELLKELLMETVQERETVKNEVEQLKAKNQHLQEELASAKEDNRAQVETMTNFMKSLDQVQQGR